MIDPAIEGQDSTNGEMASSAQEIQNGDMKAGETGADEKESASPSEGVDKSIGGSGSRTFTMRELLNELKEGSGVGNEATVDEDSGGYEAHRASTAASDGSHRHGGSSFGQDSLHPQDSLQQQYSMQNDGSIELINKVSGIDDGFRSSEDSSLFC
ncbi:hypothetical protein HPP92_007395 [Vanilla planifolia]|uniref:Uncharacterized protein n=1 Tax=Vanilla planifolia TaxID=51239 RepID=A0A835RCK0_VANPL|nr:hypothetical protein HPP92_007395 [Vanilla planifolia]